MSCFNNNLDTEGTLGYTPVVTKFAGSKPCRICGGPVLPQRRKNRWYYPRQCPDCFGKLRNPEAYRESTRTRWQRFPHPKLRPVGSTRVDSFGNISYRSIKVGEPSRWRHEHRVVAEMLLGRPLIAGEIVHHLNHDTLDNRPENLMVMSVGTHSSHHSRGNQHNKGKRLASWSRFFGACTDCGTREIPHAAKGLCNNCYQRKRH